MIFGKTVSATLTGATALGLSVNLQPSHAESGINVEDYVHDTYLIAAGATNVAIDLSEITLGKKLFAVSDGPLTLTLTQTTDRNVDIDGVMILDGEFSALKVSNPDSHAYNLMVLIAGDR